MRFDEIIKALRLCGETTECVSERIECPYCENTDDCKRELLFDAADLIESLQYKISALNDCKDKIAAQNRRLIWQTEEVERREKAAVEDLQSANLCRHCRHEVQCGSSSHYRQSKRTYGVCNHWEWRGSQEG